METDTVINNILEDLLHVLPVFSKKLLKADLGMVNFNLSRLNFAVMVTVCDQELPLSEIARRLAIPKPQVTYLVGQLEDLGLVERHPDMLDRRITNIALTGIGQETLEHCREVIRNNIREKLASLKDNELEELAAALAKLREIGSRLN